LEYWSVGVLEYWSVGVLEYWSGGVLEYGSIGVLECWLKVRCLATSYRRFFVDVAKCVDTS